MAIFVAVRGEERRFSSVWERLVETVDMVPGGTVLNIEKGQWHSLKCLESGTVLLEAKDGAYRPIGPEDVMDL